MTGPQNEAGRGFLSAPGPADDWQPTCVIHGTMKFRFAGDWWVCPGWDGEGCCAVTAEQAHENRDTYARVRPDGEPSVHGFRMALPA